MKYASRMKYLLKQICNFSKCFLGKHFEKFFSRHYDVDGGNKGRSGKSRGEAKLFGNSVSSLRASFTSGKPQLKKICLRYLFTCFRTYLVVFQKSLEYYCALLLQNLLFAFIWASCHWVCYIYSSKGKKLKNWFLPEKGNIAQLEFPLSPPASWNSCSNQAISKHIWNEPQGRGN